jgi:hypothetical protein
VRETGWRDGGRDWAGYRMTGRENEAVGEWDG